MRKFTDWFVVNLDLVAHPYLLETTARSRLSSGSMSRFKYVVRLVTYYDQGCTRGPHMAFNQGYVSTGVHHIRVCLTHQSCIVQMYLGMYKMCDGILACVL